MSVNTFNTMPQEKQLLLAERMIALHQWSEHAHGHYWKANPEQHGDCIKNNIQKSCRVVWEPITAELMVRHLSGEYPLGGFALCKDSTCAHVALDVDNYALDYADIGRRIKQSGLPLIFVTTKSGGGRIILPFKEKEPAVFARKVMEKCRLLLGLNDGTAEEIFPKQDFWNDKIKDFCGNWYALPYVGENWSEQTNTAQQVARNVNGNAMSLEDYLSKYEQLQVGHEELEAILALGTRRSGMGSGEVWDDSLTEEEFLAGAPPCIHNMHTSRVKHGGRNECLTHCAAYARRKYPDKTPKALFKLNKLLMSVPLDEEEVFSLGERVKAGKIGSAFMCEHEAVKGYCDKQNCRKVKYGPFSNGQGTEVSEPFTISIDEIVGEQRLAVITLNGSTFWIEAKDITKRMKFGDAAMEQLGLNIYKFGKKELTKAINAAWDQRGQIEPNTDYEPNAVLRDRIQAFVRWRFDHAYSHLDNEGVSRSQPKGTDTSHEVWYDGRRKPPLLMFKLEKLETFLWDRYGQKVNRYQLGEYLKGIEGVNFSGRQDGLERRQRNTWGIPVRDHEELIAWWRDYRGQSNVVPFGR